MICPVKTSSEWKSLLEHSKLKSVSNPYKRNLWAYGIWKEYGADYTNENVNDYFASHKAKASQSILTVKQEYAQADPSEMNVARSIIKLFSNFSDTKRSLVVNFIAGTSTGKNERITTREERGVDPVTGEPRYFVKQSLLIDTNRIVEGQNIGSLAYVLIPTSTSNIQKAKYIDAIKESSIIKAAYKSLSGETPTTVEELDADVFKDAISMLIRDNADVLFDPKYASDKRLRAFHNIASDMQKQVDKIALAAGLGTEHGITLQTTLSEFAEALKKANGEVAFANQTVAYRQMLNEIIVDKRDNPDLYSGDVSNGVVKIISNEPDEDGNVWGDIDVAEFTAKFPKAIFNVTNPTTENNYYKLELVMPAANVDVDRYEAGKNLKYDTETGNYYEVTSNGDRVNDKTFTPLGRIINRYTKDTDIIKLGDSSAFDSELDAAREANTSNRVNENGSLITKEGRVLRIQKSDLAELNVNYSLEGLKEIYAYRMKKMREGRSSTNSNLAWGVKTLFKNRVSDVDVIKRRFVKFFDDEKALESFSEKASDLVRRFTQDGSQVLDVDLRLTDNESNIASSADLIVQENGVIKLFSIRLLDSTQIDNNGVLGSGYTGGRGGKFKGVLGGFSNSLKNKDEILISTLSLMASNSKYNIQEIGIIPIRTNFSEGSSEAYQEANIHKEIIFPNIRFLQEKAMEMLAEDKTIREQMEIGVAEQGRVNTTEEKKEQMKDAVKKWQNFLGMPVKEFTKQNILDALKRRMWIKEVVLNERGITEDVFNKMKPSEIILFYSNGSLYDNKRKSGEGISSSDLPEAITDAVKQLAIRDGLRLTNLMSRLDDDFSKYKGSNTDFINDLMDDHKKLMSYDNELKELLPEIASGVHSFFSKALLHQMLASDVYEETRNSENVKIATILTAPYIDNKEILADNDMNLFLGAAGTYLVSRTRIDTKKHLLISYVNRAIKKANYVISTEKQSIKNFSEKFKKVKFDDKIITKTDGGNYVFKKSYEVKDAREKEFLRFIERMHEQYSPLHQNAQDIVVPSKFTSKLQFIKYAHEKPYNPLTLINKTNATKIYNLITPKPYDHVYITVGEDVRKLKSLKEELVNNYSIHDVLGKDFEDVYKKLAEYDNEAKELYKQKGKDKAGRFVIQDQRGTHLSNANSFVDFRKSEEYHEALNEYLKSLVAKHEMDEIMPVADIALEQTENKKFINKWIKTIVEHDVLGRNMNDDIPVLNAIANALTRISYYSVMFLKFKTAFWNMVVGQQDDAINSFKLYKNGFILTGTTNPKTTFVKGVRIMNRLGIGKLIDERFYEEESKFNSVWNNINTLGALPQTIAETLNQGALFMGFIQTRKGGKKFFDNFNDDGTLKEGKEGFTQDELNEIISEIANIHGNYGMMQTPAQYFMAGKVLGQYTLGWSVSKWNTWFGTNITDDNFVEQEGHYNRVVRALLKKKEWTKEDRLSFIRIAASLSVTGLAFFLKSHFSDEEEEDTSYSMGEEVYVNEEGQIVEKGTVGAKKLDINIKMPNKNMTLKQFKAMQFDQALQGMAMKMMSNGLYLMPILSGAVEKTKEGETKIGGIFENLSMSKPLPAVSNVVNFITLVKLGKNMFADPSKDKVSQFTDITPTESKFYNKLINTFGFTKEWTSTYAFWKDKAYSQNALSKVGSTVIDEITNIKIDEYTEMGKNPFEVDGKEVKFTKEFESYLTSYMSANKKDIENMLSIEQKSGGKWDEEFFSTLSKDEQKAMMSEYKQLMVDAHFARLEFMKAQLTHKTSLESFKKLQNENKELKDLNEKNAQDNVQYNYNGN